MNFLDKFRYTFDNLNEIENLKNEDKEKKNIYNKPFLKSFSTQFISIAGKNFPSGSCESPSFIPLIPI